MDLVLVSTVPEYEVVGLKGLETPKSLSLRLSCASIKIFEPEIKEQYIIYLRVV